MSKWISLKEVKLYSFVAVWIAQCEEYHDHFDLLTTRIKTLIKSTGWNFTFLYLKTCQQLTIQSINGTPIFGMSDPRVKRDVSGLPTIIPQPIRAILRDSSHADYIKVVKTTLTILSINRTFSTKVKPSLDTIIAPFTGLALTLNESSLHTVLKEMKIRICPDVFEGFISEKAGPNGSKATWTSHLDALAMLASPKQLYAFHVLAFRGNSVAWALWLDVLLIIMAFPYLIYLIWNLPMKLGKLSVVYDQAGKARIVAISNFWIQLALKPLHDAIFRYLRTVPQDGTFDQDGALQRLLKTADRKHKFYSFDLSAATDRLPIDLQAQILQLLGFDSKNWRRLLDIDWHWKGTTVKYSVGQPMGAYSSWAMLALTHHVIVRYAALQAGLTETPNYVVLGDDIVINHDAVAQEYLHIMRALGVSINMSKSVVSSEMVEFAKRWATPEHDLSPLGPGNILVTLREPFFLGTLFLEAKRKGFFSNPTSLRAVLDTLPEKYFSKEMSCALWAALGIPEKPHLFASGADVTPSFWYAFERGISQTHRDYSLYRALLGLVKEKETDALVRIDASEEKFDSNWFKASSCVSKSYSLRLLERYFRVFSPSYWLYGISFPNDYQRALDDVETLRKDFPDGGLVIGSISKLVSRDSTLDGRSIDWRNRLVVKQQANFIKSLEKSFLYELDKSGEVFYKLRFGFR